LYYRLAIVNIEMPPLRDRVEDVPSLIERFIEKLNTKLRKKYRGVTNDALRRLLRYAWPGNVRELQNVIERAMILEDGDLITSASLPSSLLERTHLDHAVGPLKDAVREFEQEYINRILRATNDDKRLAAELLGVSVSSIYRRLQNLEEDAGIQQDFAPKEPTRE
jgi:transcriptional regulator with PAS, ATPase and Fis domain